MFSYSQGVQSFSAYAFSIKLRFDCFQCKLSSVWSYIFLLNGPDKDPKQNSSNSSKTKLRSQQQEAKSVRWQTIVSQRNSFWRFDTGTLRWLARLHCLLYFLTFDWLRPAALFIQIGQFADCKGKRYLKLSKLILNWTVR